MVTIEEQVNKIFDLRGAGYSLRAIGRMVGKSHAAVHRILARDAYPYVHIPAKKVERAKATARLFAKRYHNALNASDIEKMIYWRGMGMTQTEIADRLGVTQACVSKWLKRLRGGESE